MATTSGVWTKRAIEQARRNAAVIAIQEIARKRKEGPRVGEKKRGTRRKTCSGNKSTPHQGRDSAYSVKVALAVSGGIGGEAVRRSGDRGVPKCILPRSNAEALEGGGRETPG